MSETRTIPLHQLRKVGSKRGSVYQYVTDSLLDYTDYQRQSQHLWIANWNPHTQSFYAVRYSTGNGERVNIYLHREVMELPRGRTQEQVHHLNHDTTDNRRNNLEVTCAWGNSCDKRRQSTAGQRFRGVYPNKRGWRAKFSHINKDYNLPTVSSEVWAALMFNIAARTLRPNFAVVNSIPPSELPGTKTQIELEKVVRSDLRRWGLL